MFRRRRRAWAERADREILGLGGLNVQHGQSAGIGALASLIPLLRTLNRRQEREGFRRFRPLDRLEERRGTPKITSTPMITTTTASSTSVNPLRTLRPDEELLIICDALSTVSRVGPAAFVRCCSLSFEEDWGRRSSTGRPPFRQKVPWSGKAEISATRLCYPPVS